MSNPSQVQVTGPLVAYAAGSVRSSKPRVIVPTPSAASFT